MGTKFKFFFLKMGPFLNNQKVENFGENEKSSHDFSQCGLFCWYDLRFGLSGIVTLGSNCKVDFEISTDKNISMPNLQFDLLCEF